MTPNVGQSRRLRILWLITGLARGGAEQLLVAGAERLDRERFDVEVAYLLDGYDALRPRLEALGVTVVGLGARTVGSVAWIRRLRRLVELRHYDIIHTHSPAPASVARLALPSWVTFVHTEHNVWTAYRPPARYANALTYGRNAAVIAVSKAVARSITSSAARKTTIRVVYQGIPGHAVRASDDTRRSARRTLRLDEAARVVGSVGNFRPAKGHQQLIAGFARLATRDSGLRLVLVGFGPLEERLMEQSVSQGVADQVVFAGTRDDVADILPAFDVFVLPSQQEGLGLAMIEAMAAGIPCIATSIPAVTESLRDGEAGVLVPPGDVGALSAAIARLLDDDDERQRMGQAGVAVAARFSVDAAVATLSDIYDTVCSEANAARA